MIWHSQCGQDKWVYDLLEDIRNEMREILFAQGYTLERADVAFEGNEFEDWWVCS
jgi:hypothetical protein